MILHLVLETAMSQIEIHLNGAPRILQTTCTIAQLINDLELPEHQLAVEVNREIVRRSQWDERRLESGDRVEIVHFVGGGRDERQ